MFVRVVVVALLVFVAGFGAHEVMHLLLIYAVGAQGSIIARPWHLGFLDASIWSLASIPFAALLWYVREPIALAALVANVVILVFYAVIELGDLLLEQVWNTDVSLLTTPEFNYGVPLVVILLTGLTMTVMSAIRERGRPIPE